MSRPIALTLLLLAVAAACAAARRPSPSFEHFKRQFGKSYATAEEEQRRLSIFHKNMETARQQQARNPHAQFGMNAFSDLSPEEFKATRTGFSESTFRASRGANRTVAPLFSDAVHRLYSDANAIDWRKKGAVTPVKNQNRCGGCWAFSTTGNIEGQWFLAGNPLTSFSEQELLECDTNDDACHGGTMDTAWEWLLSARNGVIDTEASWPFISGAHQNEVIPKCSYAGHSAGGKISGHLDIANDEREMATYVAMHGPISVAVDSTSFQSYQGGILTNCVSQQLDHAVLIVGFDDTHNPPYWIIKNQWSTVWGISGYMYLEKGTNQCLINQAPCTSLVGSGPNPQPPPSPPAPVPPPPAPVPPPSTNATFQQLSCTDSFCFFSCQSTTLDQDTCLSASDGSSVVVECSADGSSLLYAQYNTSDCSGGADTLKIAADTCLEAVGGSYVEFVCGSLKRAPRRAIKQVKQAKLRAVRRV